MDDEVREGVKRATSKACDAFMRRVGEKYPWLHPDYDPENSLWRQRANSARARMRRESPRRRFERLVL